MSEYLKYIFLANSVATVSVPVSNSNPSFSKISQALSNAFWSARFSGLNLVLIVSCFLNNFLNVAIFYQKNRQT